MNTPDCPPSVRASGARAPAPLPDPVDYSPRSDAPRSLTVPAGAGGERVDQALARLLPEYSRNRLAAWLREGRVTVDGLPVKPRQKVWGGESIEVHPEPDPRTAAHAPEAMDLCVRHEDASILVIDKPAGLVVHPGSGNWTGTLLNALLHRWPDLAGVPRAGIVHRLDKDTSGLLVVARTLTAQTALVRQLQERTVGRIYTAVVRGVLAPDDGEIEAPIGRHPVERTRMAVVSHGRPARTHYRVVERYPSATRVECRLDTGRTHQIRVHLASIGHPLVGDPVYRNRRAEPDPLLAGFGRQALHARRLELAHPDDGRPMAWESPLPEDLAALLSALRGEPAR